MSFYKPISWLAYYYLYLSLTYKRVCCLVFSTDDFTNIYIDWHQLYAVDISCADCSASKFQLRNCVLIQRAKQHGSLTMEVHMDVWLHVTSPYTSPFSLNSLPFDVDHNTRKEKIIGTYIFLIFPFLPPPKFWEMQH